ncbi:MAG: hypothetical protein Q4P29_01470 [Tissierellia bacterium]|nr:hypothetical protein [Tissierellia bacterium]
MFSKDYLIGFFIAYLICILLIGVYNYVKGKRENDLRLFKKVLIYHIFETVLIFVIAILIYFLGDKNLPANKPSFLGAYGLGAIFAIMLSTGAIRIAKKEILEEEEEEEYQ